MALFALSLALQIGSGAWQSDFGGHADEGAHVVTSLMARDYLAGGWREQPHPVRYAEDYYERFPKVAIGHYPPGFYLVAGLSLLPVRHPGSLLLLMAALSGGVGWASWRLGREVLKSVVGPIAIAIAVCLLPLFRTYTAIVMSDLLLVLATLFAALAFARFLRERRLRDSLAFGLWAAVAILVKGSGICLALLPPLAIAFAGRWSLLRDPRLWAAPLPVLLLAFPWMWMTREITAEGMSGLSVFEYFREAAPFYFSGLGRELGWPAAFFLGAALVAALLAATRRTARPSPRLDGLAAALAVTLCVLLIALFVPVGLDLRYLMPLVPAALLVGAWSAESLAGSRWPRAAPWIVPAFALLAVSSTWRPVEKRYTGAREAVAAVLRGSGEDGGELHPASGSPINVLIVSDATGEGALTAAAAFAGREALRISRGSKILARSDWMGRGYEFALKDANDFAVLLVRERIHFAIVEPSREDSPEHWNRTEAWLESGSAPAWLVSEIPSLRRRSGETRFSVYRTESLTETPAAGTAP